MKARVVCLALLQLLSACRASYQDPSYAAPSATLEREVVLGKEWPLPGLWTCPTRPGRFPSVVIVGGSGRVNRDAAIGANKPFRDIALGLSARGICVLRYDKRMAAHPQRVLARFDTLTIRDDTIGDDHR